MPRLIFPDPDAGTTRSPVCTVSSLFIGPFLGFVSLPFWHIEVGRQTADSPDGGQFGGLAIMAAAIATTVAGTILGIVLAGAAQLRDEPFLAFRTVALFVNTVIIATGIYFLWPLISNQ